MCWFKGKEFVIEEAPRYRRRRYYRHRPGVYFYSRPARAHYPYACYPPAPMPTGHPGMQGYYMNNYLQYPQYNASSVPTPGSFNPQPVGFQSGHMPIAYGNPGYNPYGYNHLWYGRSGAEIDNDNRIIAARDGVHEPLEITPREPKEDQMFWVREVDGTWTLRTWFTIDNDLRPGRWQLDAQRGNPVYIRQADN